MKFICALAAIILCAAHPVMASVFLEDLTWVELKQAIALGAKTAIVPIGGTEQNGPAMALGKHNARVKFLAEKIASQLGDALVAPVMAYVPEGAISPPTAHMKFPGTLTISDDAFMQILESTAKSLHHAGFRNIVFIGDHGSYQSDLAAVAAKLNTQKIHTLAALQYYAVVQHNYVDALKAKGHSQAEIGTHAALADTSLQLAVAPDMVRTELLKNKVGAADGVYGGPPTAANAALGQLGVDLIVAETVSAIQNFEAKN
jgi:creatinine amidohydrolase